jgi:glucan phosphoethanolaminetransferase (alkaline phosphatase superfamily)
MHRRIPLSLAALIVLIMLPNLARFLWEHNLATWVTAFVIPAFLIASWFAICGRWLWLACLTIAPFAILAPAELYYVAKYHHASTYNVLGTVVATNPAEALGYFGWLMVPFALATVASLALPVVAAKQCYARRLIWNGRLRTWILLLTLGLPIALFVVGATGNRPTDAGPMIRGLANIRSLALPVEPGYPFGVIVRVRKFYRDWNYVYTSSANLKNFRFHTTRLTSVRQRQVYVLVIGESSARSHWQLFGYERPTNPELSKMGDLIPISDMLTSYAATQEAVPIILTRKPVTSFHTLSKEASILRAMSEAGYQTWWISNQVTLGKYESPVAVYSLDAAHVLYLNTSTWTSDRSLDEKLLEPLKEVIRNGSGDEFIVLHMMGSHIKYELRYPAGSAYFRPTLSDSPPIEGADPRETNSYDNTIRYTDHVLAQIIGSLRESNVISALWYESDHGETLTNGTCGYSGHGYGTRNEFQIPTIFWYSEAYAANFPERVHNLMANARQPTISANTFESLIDMAGLTFPGHDTTMSLFSAEWKYRPRIVHSFWELDFDKAKFGKDCQLVEPPEGDHHE